MTLPYLNMLPDGLHRVTHIRSWPSRKIDTVMLHEFAVDGVVFVHVESVDPIWPRRGYAFSRGETCLARVYPVKTKSGRTFRMVAFYRLRLSLVR
jgi:hypothetical protein